MAQTRKSPTTRSAPPPPPKPAVRMVYSLDQLRVLTHAYVKGGMPMRPLGAAQTVFRRIVDGRGCSAVGAEALSVQLDRHWKGAWPADIPRQEPPSIAELSAEVKTFLFGREWAQAEAA